MSRQSKQEFLAIMEAMAVESARGGELGHVDVLVAGQHVARAEYNPRRDSYEIDSIGGEFSL